MNEIAELIRLVNEAQYAAKQPLMDGSGTRKAIEILAEISQRKLVFKAHEEEKQLRANQWRPIVNGGFASDDFMVQVNGCNVRIHQGETVIKFRLHEDVKLCTK